MWIEQQAVLGHSSSFVSALQQRAEKPLSSNSLSKQ